MKREPLFGWDEATGTASCLLTDGERYYTGIAYCHPDDRDMMSEKTGYEIALRRAEIKALKDYVKELKLKLSALNQLYYSMKHSTKFNETSYENKMLQRQIRLLETDIEEIKIQINDNMAILKAYIAGKDIFYKLTRERRNKVKDS